MMRAFPREDSHATQTAEDAARAAAGAAEAGADRGADRGGERTAPDDFGGRVLPRREARLRPRARGRRLAPGRAGSARARARVPNPPLEPGKSTAIAAGGLGERGRREAEVAQQAVVDAVD